MASRLTRATGRRRLSRQFLPMPWLASLALVAAACGAGTPASTGSEMRAAARQAVNAIARSFATDLQSRLASHGSTYQPCSQRSALSFYSTTATITAKAGTSVSRYQSQIVPELRRLGWTVTVVDVAKLHTFGGPVRHPIDRIRRGSLFGAVNVVAGTHQAETILFVNTKCFKPGKAGKAA
jgi:hypothetical protein